MKYDTDLSLPVLQLCFDNPHPNPLPVCLPVCVCLCCPFMFVRVMHGI